MDFVTKIKKSFDEWITQQNEDRKKKAKKLPPPSGTLMGGKQAKQLSQIKD